MTEEKKLEPELRFPGFHKPWEEKKLGEIAERIIAGATPSRKVDKYWNGDIPWMSSGEIHNRYVHSTKETITGEGFNNTSLTIIPKKSLLMAIGGQGKTRGKVAINKIDLTTNQSVIALILKSQININYIFNLLDYKYKYIRHFSTGTAGRRSLNIGIVEAIKFYFPFLPEQEKIGKFFYAIDKKLNLQREKIEELKSYKKGMMQRIFDQEIRFKDEDGRDYPDWEEKKLGKYIVNINNRLGENKNLPVLSSTLSGIYLQNKYFKNNVSSRDLSNYKIIKRDQFTYRSMSDTGDFKFNIQHVVDKGIVSPAYPVFDVKIEVNKSWLYYYMNNSNYIDRQLLKLYQGGTRFALPFSKLIKLYIELPSLPEQEKIANFLSAIDRRIELEEEKLELYEDFKKGLMQRMFV